MKELAEKGSCYSLSAPSNFGKSSFLRQLAVRSHPTLLFVYVDLNLRADDTPQAFYELILRELLSLPLLANNERLQASYAQVCAVSANPFGVARAFLSGLQTALQIAPHRLALVLDELDKSLTLLPGSVFLHLRALRDRYPEKLSYVCGTLVPLPACGREEEEGIAEFYELFESGGIVRLKGLSLPELSGLLPANSNLPTSTLSQIWALTWGHPTLTTKVVKALGALEQGPKLGEEILSTLKAVPEIQRECRRLWESLPESEQKTLLQWLEGIRSLTVTPYLGSLEERGLVRQANGCPVIFSPLFEWFLREKLEGVELPQPGFKELAYNPHREEVIFDGGVRRLTLNGNAATLFKYLYLRQSKPWCSKDELISAVWGNAAYSPENLDKLVSDLRQELGDSEKKIIRTIPRKGLLMVEVREWTSE